MRDIVRLKQVLQMKFQEKLRHFELEGSFLSEESEERAMRTPKRISGPRPVFSHAVGRKFQIFLFSLIANPVPGAGPVIGVSRTFRARSDPPAERDDDESRVRARL